MDYSTLVVAVATLLAAIVGAIAANVYRDYRDRPILRFTIETLRRVRMPIELPSDIHERIRAEGGVKEWLKPLVKWDEDFAFSENRFTLDNLKDLRHLMPKCRERYDREIERFTRFRDSLQSPTTPPSPDAKYALAMIRGFWLQHFKEDIFVSYEKDPQKVSEIVISHLNGTIEQATIALHSVDQLIEHLERGFAPNANANERISEQPATPESPREPFLFVEILVHNLGKSETLLQGDASLYIGPEPFRLTGLVERLGVEVYSGKYFRVKPNCVAELTFTQHPDHTTQAQLTSLNAALEHRVETARIELKDFAGRTFKINSLKLRAFQT